MDGQVTSSGSIVSLTGGDDASAGVETHVNDLSRHLDSQSEMADLQGDHEQMRMQEDDIEQPDGQRSSLSLEDDGGSHFESHSQETVIRRGGPLRDVNIASPTQHDGCDDNDVIFNPAQRLNFDDDEEDEDDDDDNIENIVDIPVNVMDSTNGSEGDYMLQRPLVNGSDMTETGASGRVPTAQDQGQNIRIIEGHDSSLLDDGGNSAFSFNFLQTQMIQLPLVSPSVSGLGNISRSEDETHNLYDSLEREDGSSPYGQSHEQAIENNTSEYFSAGSVSLVVANSQGQDSDSLWAQDDSSDHGSYLSHSQQHFHSNHNLERNPPRHQSPPRNFQVEASNMFAQRRRADMFLGERNIGSCGDVQNAEEDNTDVLSLELSEEGLSRNTQLYAQPISSSSSVVGAIGGSGVGRDDSCIPPQFHSEYNNNRAPVNNNQNSVFENTCNKSGLPGSSSSNQPKNLAWNQSLPTDDAVTGNHMEGDGVDTQTHERQAGAGSSSTVTHKPVGDTSRPPKKQASGKIQIRRPAVQGSASNSDNKKVVGVNPRAGSSIPSKKAAQPVRPGSQGDSGGRGNAGTSNQKSDLSKASAGAMQITGGSQSRQPQGQATTLACRASSHTSLSTTTNSINSRVSGVGKESHMLSNAQTALTRGACQLIVGTESNFSSSVGARQDSGKGDVHSGSLSSHVSGGMVSGHSQSHPQMSQSLDRVRPGASQHSQDLHTSQSLTKHRTSHPQLQPNSSGQNDHPSDSQLSLDHLPPRPNDNQQRRNFSGSGGSSISGGNHLQHSHHPHNPQHPAFGIQQVPLQRSHSGFPIQPAYNQGASPSGSESSHQSFNRDAVVTQMDALKRQGQKLSPSEPSQMSAHHSHLDNDIQGMEEVRSHLHSMLRLGADNSMADHPSHDHADIASDLLLSEPPVNRQLYFDTDSSSFMGNNPQDDMSEILENFPTFSSKIFSEMSGISTRSDTASQGENNYLRESLEKERYRRKHCEEQIQRLNTKMLEVQQQLAVAVSTDKRKDLMIEQLDKQLAKVVEGWKKREAEKDEFMKILSQEKEQIEETLKSQQTMINNFERDLSQTVEELRGEKERSAQKINTLKDELYEAQRAKENTEEILSAEREKFSEMTAKWNDLKESVELAEKRAQQAQERLVQEQDGWVKREQELSSKITEVKEANQKVINMEKVKLEEQKKKREEAEAQGEELKTELKKAVLDMEQLVREKESQKVEMAIMEAKFESAQRKLEADLHAQMEKEIADQASECHSRIETALEEAAERHRKQVTELHSRHQRDMERQTAALNDERQKKEEDYRKQITDLEEKLQELRTENTSLRQSKIKLESQRMEILTKLQFMMQSQWNEAVSLLVSTPQKKGLNSSFLSNQNGNQLASAMAVTDGSTSVTSLNLVTSGPTAVTSQANEGQAPLPSLSQPLPPPALENGGGEQNEEMERMNRVEEYLQRLTHHTDIPMTRNDLQVSRGDQSSSCPSSAAVPVSSNNTDHIYSSAIAQHQHQQHQQSQLLSSSDQGSTGSSRGNDFQIKPSNNLSHSHLTHVHGFVSGQNRKTLITTSGHSHSVGPELQYQAVAMRSPQQSSSRFNPDASHPPAKMGFEHQSPPANHPYLFNRHLGQNQTSPHRSHQPQQFSSEQQYFSPQKPQHHQSRVRFSDDRGDPARASAGDHGDHKDMKLITSSAGNINLYSPASPTFTSSPVGLRGSPSSWMGSGLYMGASATAARSPGGNGSGRAFGGMDSPVKRHRPRYGHHQGRNTDHLNESLSPPVKQAAEKDQTDNASETSSGFHDPNSRLQAHYSRLSESMEEHQSRQGELQHYVKMLLQKAPGSVCSEPERDIHSDHEILESSRELTEKLMVLQRFTESEVDLDLNDTATAVELTSQLSRLQHLREQQSARSFERQNPSSSQHNHGPSQGGEHMPSHLSEFVGDNGVISTQGLSEISQLLNMYREQWEINPQMADQVNMAGQLVDALKAMEAPVSAEHVSRKEEKKTGQVAKQVSPRSQHTRKIKDLTKTRKPRSGSQSADVSVSAPADSLDKSTSSKTGGPVKKGSFVTESSREKKPGTGKPAGSKSNNGPAWK